MTENYSVLMSVYYKEKPEHLRESMYSIYNQTIPTDDFVLICDGPLNEGLDAVIKEMITKFGHRLHVERLKQNSGLGNALNIGIRCCKNELVARMDSDDISRPERCEKQLSFFVNNPEISLLSGTVCEFSVDKTRPIGMRKLPLNNSDIIKFSKKRNPMNHPCVMFKKSAVIAAGGYLESYHLFEDYYLWVRMFLCGFKARNMSDVLLDMRTPPDLYIRRGGVNYIKSMLAFHKWMLNSEWSSMWDFLSGTLPHVVVCILPNCIRKKVYKILRNNP